MPVKDFEIEYAEEAIRDLHGLRAFEQKAILEGIETHLRYRPEEESRSRIKALAQPFWSQYRLRINEFRVYYDVESAKKLVSVLRIVEKGRRETPEEKDA